MAPSEHLNYCNFKHQETGKFAILRQSKSNMFIAFICLASFNSMAMATIDILQPEEVLIPLSDLENKNTFRGMTLGDYEFVDLQNGPVTSIKSRQINYAGFRQNEPVDLIIPPYDSYDLETATKSREHEVSNVIDRKRFIEAYPSRCMTSTYLQDPGSVEPSFIFIKPQSEIRLNATSPIEHIKLTGFEPNKKTVVLIHGFTQSYPDTVWLRRTRALFESNGVVQRQNLIIMDYGRASHQSYAQVAAMASGMGSFLANFLMKLIQSGANPMSMHLVGHSLGAHVAGFAGKKLRPKLGRITALDAAGPCFGKILANDERDRLTADDAFEVDVYHYDDDFLGLPGQNGQFDIYVNGGYSQPGCTDNVNTMFQAMITMIFRRNKVLSESHTRSTEVATARLGPSQCQEVAYECRNYEAFSAGECGKCDDSNNQCFLMGFDYQYADVDEIPLRTTQIGKKMYIKTSPIEPFCQQHYQILIKFEPSPELAQQAKRNRWRVQLEPIDMEGRRLEPITVSNQMTPNIYSHLLLTDRLLRVKSLRVQVRSSDGKLVQMVKQQQKQFSGAHQLPFKIFSIEVNFMSNISPKVRQSLSSRLCPIGFNLDPTTTPGASSLRIGPNSIEQNAEPWLYFEACPEAPPVKMFV